MSFRHLKIAGVMAAATLALAACSNPEPEQSAEDSNAVETIAPDEAPTAAPSAEEPVPVAEPATNSAAIDVPPEAPVAPDAQVLEDADATGMTARVSRDEAPANDAPANDGTMQ